MLCYVDFLNPVFLKRLELCNIQRYVDALEMCISTTFFHF